MPSATGPAAIMDAWMKMSAIPGFSLQWTPVRADVGAAGDVGYTVGTYEASMSGATEKGKYVAVWKKQSDGTWKVKEDLFKADAMRATDPGKARMLPASGVTWGAAPPVLPAGAKMAVVSGDPGKPELYAIRLQLPAGYRIAPHWHPTDEHVTVLSGTFGLGMGETFGSVKDLPAGSYALLPADMRHYAMAVTATTVQVHGMGPFVLNYVNATIPVRKVARVSARAATSRRLPSSFGADDDFPWPRDGLNDVPSRLASLCLIVRVSFASSRLIRSVKVSMPLLMVRLTSTSGCADRF